jgi:uncharacterized protein (DUF433 family)
MNQRIVIRQDVHFGKPVIRGTRVPVSRVLAEVASGVSFEDIQRQYGVTVEDIRAAIGFANEIVNESTFVPDREP